jgi:hypothetical protein
MNTKLFANPQLFQAYNNDPRMAMAQGLMQQGASTAPVRSPLEGLARALTAGVGGLQARQTTKGYQQQDDQYRQGLAEALKGGDVIGALQNSNQPQLQQMALEAKIRQAMDPAKDPLLQVYDPNTKTMVYKPQSQSAGQQAAAPELPKAPTTRQVGDPNRPGVLLDQEFDPNAPGGWKTVGSRLPEPKQGPETWRVVSGPDGKPTHLESSLGNQKALPGHESGGGFKQENTLRDEYNTLTKDFRTVQDAYNKLTQTSDTGAGDMSLLYSYVKLLDPGSVVRESEFATAAASGSYGERIQGLVQRVLTGERLPSSLRDEFKMEAKGIYQGQKIGYDNAGKTYAELAKRANINPENVVIPYATEQPVQPTPATTRPPGGPPKVLTYNPQTGQME